MLLCLIFFLYYYLGRTIHLPEEEIHFFEYGMVGILFARAIAEHVQEKWKIFMGALILSGLAGWLDEGIQGLMPTRHYDLRDVVLNIVSASMGLAIFLIFPSKSDTFVKERPSL